MKSLMLLFQNVLEESSTWCRISTIRDLKTVTDRVKHEGLSFLTITLPSFGKDFERSLDLGYVDRNLFQGFPFKGGLPRFLGGFLDLVFDRASGRLLHSPSIVAIRCVRQLTLMFAKINIECSDRRTRRAIDGYMECERDVHSRVANATDTWWGLSPERERYIRISRLLWAELFVDIQRNISEQFLPKHGPGATADRHRGNSKYRQQEWTSRLETHFPYGEVVLPRWGFFDPSAVTYLEPGQERPVRVITVPKTLKTPRIIAIEPTCMQYVQQGVLAAMCESIRKFDIPRHFICFDDQTPNQRLAKEGSSSGELATLDLSEASDRVSNQHVMDLLRDHPTLASMVASCRSTKADVPGYGIIPLSKFASMGSALCFPFESLVFMTVIFCGIEVGLNRPITNKDIKSLFGRVRVYGDDIIVPVEFVAHVNDSLKLFGFKVNHTKSFWTGKFRESCGKDYYDGVDVSIVRVRDVFPSSREHAHEMVSLVSLRNQLFTAGYESTCEFLDRHIERFIPFPAVESTSPVLGKLTHGGFVAAKFSRTLHVPLVKGAVVSARLPVSILNDEFALQKVFLMYARRDRNIPEFSVHDSVFTGISQVGDDHLRRAGRPDSVNIKIGWHPAY